MLFGILIWSMFHMFRGEYLASAALFAILLNFKHIFIYFAPVYFVYLLRSCFKSGELGDNPQLFSFSPKRLIRLGLVVITIFLLSFGPFILDDTLRSVGISSIESLQSNLNKLSSIELWKTSAINQMSQIISRLFPFKRGLVHAYWAPNFWVFYNVAEKSLLFLAPKCIEVFVC